MGRKKMARGFVLFLRAAVLGGCASVVPEALREQLDREIRFSDLQQDPDHYQGRMVVLGGRIAAVRPSADVTELDMTELPLTESRDSPRLSAPPGGRFVVVHQGPLDPERYHPQRLVTVVGRVHGGRTLPGQDIPQPVIAAEYFHLWPYRPPWHRFTRMPSFSFAPFRHSLFLRGPSPY